MTFDTLGPFAVPIDEHFRVDKKQIKKFWEKVEERQVELSDAIGCYIFALAGPQGVKAWYIGMTQKRTFKGEIYQPHKLEIYNGILVKKGRAKPVIYLLPQLTPKTRKFVAMKARIRRSPKILENLLIGAALGRNRKLVNKQQTRYARNLYVPGFLNERPGKRSKAASDLNQMLGS